jgi:hypothetical protein
VKQQVALTKKKMKNENMEGKLLNKIYTFFSSAEALLMLKEDVKAFLTLKAQKMDFFFSLLLCWDLFCSFHYFQYSNS